MNSKPKLVLKQWISHPFSPSGADSRAGKRVPDAVTAYVPIVEAKVSPQRRLSSYGKVY